MWFADIYCDTQWVAERNGILGPTSSTLRGPKSSSLGIDIEFHFFGDEGSVRHVRVLMRTDDQRIAETCLNLNIQTWVASLEVAVMMQTKRPFQTFRLQGSQTFAIVLGQGADDAPAVTFNVGLPESARLDFRQIAYGMTAWGGDMSHYLFYFRRLVDGSLPLDVRWLNGYRLLEWHFVRNNAGLAKSPVWREFAARFEPQLRPFLRRHQAVVGLLEEARALAAHAGLDERSEAERTLDPRNAMEKTFRVVEQMVSIALNEHPALMAGPVRFSASTTESSRGPGGRDSAA